MGIVIGDNPGPGTWMSAFIPPESKLGQVKDTLTFRPSNTMGTLSTHVNDAVAALGSTSDALKAGLELGEGAPRRMTNVPAGLLNTATLDVAKIKLPPVFAGIQPSVMGVQVTELAASLKGASTSLGDVSNAMRDGRLAVEHLAPLEASTASLATFQKPLGLAVKGEAKINQAMRIKQLHLSGALLAVGAVATAVALEGAGVTDFV